MSYIKIDESKLRLPRNTSPTGLTVSNSSNTRIPFVSIIDFLEENSIDLNGIERVVISSSSKLTELDGLRRMPNLSSLSIETNKINSLSFLSDTPSLDSLEIAKNHKIDLSPLSESTVKELGLTKPSIDQLQFVENECSLIVLALQGVDFDIINDLQTIPEELSLVQCKGNKLDLNNTELRCLNVSFCPRLEGLSLPNSLQQLFIESAKKLSLSNIDGGELKKLTIQGAAKVSSWDFLNKWKYLESIEITATKILSAIDKSNISPALKKAFIAGLPNAVSNLEEISSTGLTISNGEVVFSDGHELEYYPSD